MDLRDWTTAIDVAPDGDVTVVFYRRWPDGVIEVFDQWRCPAPRSRGSDAADALSYLVAGFIGSVPARRDFRLYRPGE